MEKQILAWQHAARGLPALVAAGPLLFTGGCDGHRIGPQGAIAPHLAGEPELQSEIAYAAIQHLLRQASCELSSVVRLDHATSSQDWLPRRQSVRQRFFGRPAPLASTGVAAKMAGINMLTASAIAVRDPAAKQVLVAGSRYGMANLASVVRGGPFLFLSGIRATTDPRNGAAMPEETADSFVAQTRLCYEIIGEMLESAGATRGAIVRLDCYLRDISRAPEEAAIRLPWLAGTQCASTVVGLPLGGRGEVEITALALDPAHRESKGGGFVFVQAGPDSAGDREAQLHSALSVLEARLQAAGSSLSRTVRLDLYLRDIYFSDLAHRAVLRRFGESPPVVCTIGAELADGAEVQLSAIALCG
jgi:enamine deaminase RidA (YjgF/YER057c/UK114 family)